MIDQVLSDEGWPYASSPPVDKSDPGRFHALFGRDSLITALQLLPDRPDIARATLAALARRRGQILHSGTLEEPGKIGHEFRDAPPGRGTEITATIVYDPPGGDLGKLIAKLFQKEPKIQARRDLRRFKQLMETGEISTSEAPDAAPRS